MEDLPPDPFTPGPEAHLEGVVLAAFALATFVAEDTLAYCRLVRSLPSTGPCSWTTLIHGISTLILQTVYEEFLAEDPSPARTVELALALQELAEEFPLATWSLMQSIQGLHLQRGGYLQDLPTLLQVDAHSTLSELAAELVQVLYHMFAPFALATVQAADPAASPSTAEDVVLSGLLALHMLPDSPHTFQSTGFSEGFPHLLDQLVLLHGTLPLTAQAVVLSLPTSGPSSAEGLLPQVQSLTKDLTEALRDSSRSPGPFPLAPHTAEPTADDPTPAGPTAEGALMVELKRGVLLLAELSRRTGKPTAVLLEGALPVSLNAAKATTSTLVQQWLTSESTAYSFLGTLASSPAELNQARVGLTHLLSTLTGLRAAAGEFSPSAGTLAAVEAGIMEVASWSSEDPWPKAVMLTQLATLLDAHSADLHLVDSFLPECPLPGETAWYTQMLTRVVTLLHTSPAGLTPAQVLDLWRG